MASTQASVSTVFDAPAAYEIRIHGRLEPMWRDRLEGMKIRTGMSADGAPVTTLTGELPDQAALVGVLDLLYKLHVTVLSVMRMEEPIEID